ncbi:MAG: hypothetical protein QOJ52_832 [Acidimicrobiaceae bacterium]|nr:hypothetical protein [Acidimicrobiaceae bacterium]
MRLVSPVHVARSAMPPFFALIPFVPRCPARPPPAARRPCFSVDDRLALHNCLGRLGYHNVVTFQPGRQAPCVTRCATTHSQAAHHLVRRRLRSVPGSCGAPALKPVRKTPILDMNRSSLAMPPRSPCDPNTNGNRPAR